MADVIHRNRPDLAPDAVEVAIYGVSEKVFTLILSGTQKTAWVEIVGGEDKILISFPIDAVAELILRHVEEGRRQGGGG